MVQSLVCSALFAVKVERFAIPEYCYSGLAHEAFKIAEISLQKKLFTGIAYSYSQSALQSPFLKSFCYTKQSCNNPCAYALVCSDICADNVWIDGDEQCRTMVKELASKIVYCPIDYTVNLFGYDKYILATGCAEFKKLFLLCNNLKNNDKYSFAIVTPREERSSTCGVVVVEKLADEITFNVYGIFDDRIIEFLETIIMDAVEREKILIKSLRKYYSPALVKQCQQQFGLLGDDGSWWQRIVQSACEGVKKLKLVDYLPSL